MYEKINFELILDCIRIINVPGWQGSWSQGLNFSQWKPSPVCPGGQGPHLSWSKHSTLGAHLQFNGWLHKGPGKSKMGKNHN